MDINDGSSNNGETVNVTSVNGSTFTITRGAHGTTAKAHSSGAGVGVPGDFGQVTGGSHPGTAPGPSFVSLSDGKTYTLAQVIVPNESNLTGAQHETGHGFGYSHSRKLSFSTVDYQDATDVMSAYTGTFEDTSLGSAFGGSVLGSFSGDKGPGLNAIDLDLQGWIPGARHYAFDNGAANQATVTLHALSDPNALSDSTDYLEARVPAAVTIENAAAADSNGNTLAPTNPPTCNPAPYGCTTSSYYTVEYRQNTGWDSGFPTSAVVLHLFGGDSRSYWVDSAGSGGLLAAGGEYVDPANKTFLAVNSISGTSARLTLGSGRLNPTLIYSGDLSGDFDDTVTLAGDLTVGGAPVPNQSVTLTVGTQSCTTVTDLTGHASCEVTLTQAPADVTASASFAGDSAYNAASGSGLFTINREETTTTYTGPTVIANGVSVSLSGVLKEDGTLPIAGRTLTLILGNGNSAQSCTSQPTDASGSASCSVVPNQPLGPGSVSASFSGDTFYLPSVDARSTILFGFLDRGAFVVGDENVRAAADDTFWGAQWGAMNSLSGGSAPTSFKGYASETTAPPTCSAWRGDPGNSGHPPAQVPDYMGVIVSSSIAKSGPTSNGDTVEIIVVKTDAGYDGNPGHAGTGTIVGSPSDPTQPAVFCHS
jgi:hypothetical protein